jgi:hypothetical protein
MAVVDCGFDNSAATIGGLTVSPLTSFSYSNRPAFPRVTGADQSPQTGGHLYAAGRHNRSLNIGFLGSTVPDAATPCAIAVTLNGVAQTTYPKTILTSVRVSGRKDGAIEGTVTARVTPIAASTGLSGFTGTDVSFNGSTVAFGSTTSIAGVNSLTYEATCAEPEDSGSDATDVEVSAGIPERTVTLEVMGSPSLTEGTIGALTVGWNDGGSLGTMTLAQVFVNRTGGDVDGAVTTEYIFKPEATT